MSDRAASFRVQPLSGSPDHRSRTDGGAPALRYGDPRVQALAGALAITIHLIGGFTDRSLRPLVAGLLGEPPYGHVAAAFFSLPFIAATSSHFSVRGLTLPRIIRLDIAYLPVNE